MKIALLIVAILNIGSMYIHYRLDYKKEAIAAAFIAGMAIGVFITHFITNG